MLTLIVAMLAQATTSPAQSPQGGADIVVVGQRLEGELAACLARGCPPAQDIEASLQASVAQFADGRYKAARRTLQASLRRNAAHAAVLPGPVSSLHATLGHVAQHEGDVDLWRRAAHDAVVVLRTHLGPAHPATLREELLLADMLVRGETMRSAGAAYARIERLAGRGQPAIASAAAFRQAALLIGRRRLGEAEAAAARAVAIGGAADPIVAETGAVIAARLAVARGNADAVDVLIDRLRQSPSRDIRVVELPPRNLEEAERLRMAFLPVELAIGNDRQMFADIGYRIRPDGRTEDVEVLRGTGLAEWEKPILRQVSARRYIALDVAPGHPGVYRVDRYTVRGAMRWITTGSRILRQRGPLEVHVVDMTATRELMAQQRAAIAAEGAAPRPAAP